LSPCRSRCEHPRVKLDDLAEPYATRVRGAATKMDAEILGPVSFEWSKHIAVVRGPVRGWGPVRGSGAWCGWCWGANGFGAGGALAPATRGPRGGLQENEVPAARLRPSLAGVRASGRALGPRRRRARHRGPVHQPDWPWVFRRRAGGRREVALRRF
jgi:hypothetical protein